MEKKIYFGGGLGSQILVIGQTGELLSDPDSYERVELPAVVNGPGIMIQNDFVERRQDETFVNCANRKERRRLMSKKAR